MGQIPRSAERISSCSYVSACDVHVVTAGRSDEYADPVPGSSTAYTKRLSEMAALQAKTKAAERKRLWIAAVKSVKRSRKSRHSVPTSMAKPATDANRPTRAVDH